MVKQTVRVSMRQGYAGALQPLATFRFDGTSVHAEWHDDGYGKDVEAHGIVAMVNGKATELRPGDGEAFIRALPLAYSGSTLMVVQVEPG
jgi:hypothetical protein